MMQISWVKIEKGARKVCFMDDLLFHKNVGPNVDNNFVDFMDFCGGPGRRPVKIRPFAREARGASGPNILID